MDKKTFKEFCKNEFETHGFKKQRNVFYLTGHDLLCGIDLQKSNYGDVYYVNYYYFIGEFEAITGYPTHYESDIQGRITVMSRKQTSHGKQFMIRKKNCDHFLRGRSKKKFSHPWITVNRLSLTILGNFIL